MSDLVKIFFKLKIDHDGYPPVSEESLWGKKTEEKYKFIIDNIPFFTSDATLHDIVSAVSINNVYWFERILISSENSLLRAVMYNPEKTEFVRAALKKIGCITEWDRRHNLISISVSKEIPLSLVQNSLKVFSKNDWLDYEEPILRNE